MKSNIEIVDIMQNIGHNHGAEEAKKTYATYMSPDLVVIEPDSLPYGGRFSGKAELEEFERIYQSCWSHSEHRVLRCAAVDDHVVTLMEMTATARKTGRSITFNVTEWWRVRNQQIDHIEIFYADTNRVLETLAVPPRHVNTDHT